MFDCRHMKSTVDYLFQTILQPVVALQTYDEDHAVSPLALPGGRDCVVEVGTSVWCQSVVFWCEDTPKVRDCVVERSASL